MQRIQEKNVIPSSFLVTRHEILTSFFLGQNICSIWYLRNLQQKERACPAMLKWPLPLLKFLRRMQKEK